MALRLQGAAIGATGGCGFGGEHANALLLYLTRHRINQAQHRHPGFRLGHIKGQGVGGVASHHHGLSTLLPQPAHHLSGNAANFSAVAAAVGNTGRIAHIQTRLARPMAQ